MVSRGSLGHFFEVFLGIVVFSCVFYGIFPALTGVLLVLPGCCNNVVGFFVHVIFFSNAFANRCVRLE